MLPSTATIPLPTTNLEKSVYSSTKTSNKKHFLGTKTSKQFNKITQSSSSKNNLLKRSKRSTSTRALFGTKRFGSSAPSSRKFQATSSFKSGKTSQVFGRFYGSSSSSSKPSFASTSKASSQLKSIPNFLQRNQRSKSFPKPSKTTSSSIKPSASSGYSILQARSRRFGYRPLDDDSKIEDDFEVSEAVVQSVTEETYTTSAAPTSRFRRPSKFSKFNSRTTTAKSFVAKTSSKPSVGITLPRRNRHTLKNTSTRNSARKHSPRNYGDDINPHKTENSETGPTNKKRFTLTTTFSVDVKPTSSFMDSLEETENSNKLQEESVGSKRRNKNRSMNFNSRKREGTSYKPVFDSEDNEVTFDKPKALPLPVFGRTRGTKRPPKFDPRTIRSSSTSSSQLTYTTGDIASIFNDSIDSFPFTSSTYGPITVTDIFTTTKTLPVHLGARTSFATITTTAYSTSVLQPEDLTTVTIGDRTKTILSAITAFPDANLPPEKQFTVVTEIFVTSTEILSTSLVAIKVGYGTRTDAVINKQILTTLATQTNTLLEQKTSTTQQPYPYYPNPFAPPIPPQNSQFSLSLSEHSFVSTQTLTSTTVLPLFFNGKTIFTTLTSTTLNEETLVKTTTVKVPQAPSAQPFIFPQPVFILPSVTTEVTIHFTAHNGEIFSIVTLITVPLALNGHTRYARSAEDAESSSSIVTDIKNTQTSDTSSTLNEYFFSSIQHSNGYNIQENPNFNLQSSFSSIGEESYTASDNKATILLNNPNLVNSNDFSVDNYYSKSLKDIQSYAQDELKNIPITDSDVENNFLETNRFYSRKLLQNDEDSLKSEDEVKDEPLIGSDETAEDIVGTQSGDHNISPENIFAIDMSHLLGLGFNDDTSERPIPSVRVIPTRRAYIRRIRPENQPQLTPEDLRDEYNFRNNPQNFPSSNFYQPTRGRIRNENYGITRNNPNYGGTVPFPPQDLPGGSYGPVRGMQYYNSPNRGTFPPGPNLDSYGIIRAPQNLPGSRFNRLPERYEAVRNTNGSPLIPNSPDEYDSIRGMPSFSPTRQSVPNPTNGELDVPTNRPTEESPRFRSRTRTPPSATTSAPRRMIRLRRPASPQQPNPGTDNTLLDRQPIVNALPDTEEKAEFGAPIRARGPAIVSSTAIVRDRRPNRIRGGDSNDIAKNERQSVQSISAVPLTYYTTFTYLTTFLNGPSTAYSTREAVVSNIATETLNPSLVGLIKTRGGFTTQNGVPTAVPLGSRAQGPTTTIVNLASRVQLYNSDVYYGNLNSAPLEDSEPEKKIKPADTSFSTRHLTDIASLPKTYYTQFTYYYTLRDGDKSTHSQRSETVTNIESESEPFVTQDFASTIDNSGILTINPTKQLVKLGLRTAGGTTTEVNLELKTLVRFDGLKNVLIDRGSITPTVFELGPSETDSIYNNYLDPDDAEVQDQQTYPQTVPIQPSFASETESSSGSVRSSNREATPEIPDNNRVIRTQSQRGPLRIATTVLQRPGSLRSGLFANRPGVRVRVRPVSTRTPPGVNSKLEEVRPVSSSILASFDSTRDGGQDEPSTEEFDDEDAYTTEDEDNENVTTEEELSTTEETNQDPTPPGRKRLKITIRRSPGITQSRTNSRFIRPTRTRPRFYVVTKTATPDGESNRPPKRPVSVKVSRRPRPSLEPQYETYTKMTSVPVVFGLSTTYRNALVTSSSLIRPNDVSIRPSKTVVLTYFTTTTYTVPFNVDGINTFTTIEETNSRIATETLDADADLSFVSTTTLEYADAVSPIYTPAYGSSQPAQTLRPQVVNNQLNVGPRVNLVTRVSNGVSLIVASDGESEQAPSTLQPTMMTDALMMMNKGVTTLYEPKTFYTTFTFFTTFFSGGTPSISTSEQVITNVYSVPVTQTAANEPITVTETSEHLVRTTLFSTHTFYATLFNGTETVVTPLEELQSSVATSTETYYITKTIVPTASAGLPSQIRPTGVPQPHITTTSVYRTLTNYVTLFRGSESIISPLEEIETEIVTLTLDNTLQPLVPRPLMTDELYTTRTIQATNTHYITLFSGSESILSSITEVAPSVITELVKQLQGPTTTRFFQPSSYLPHDIISSPMVEPTFQDLVPSVRTQYTTLTYFTTLFTDSSTVLSSREEVATSYITLFVPAPLPGATRSQSFTPPSSTLSLKVSERPVTELRPSSNPESEVLTFYTTYTYYTTLFRGTETIISDSETVVTQYVTITATPAENAHRQSTSQPPSFSKPVQLDTLEIRIEPTSTLSSISSTRESYPNDEKLEIIGVSTKTEKGGEVPSVFTGIPTTDSNGATHILFTDFIVPSSVDKSGSSRTAVPSRNPTPSLPNIIHSQRETTNFNNYDTTLYPYEASTPSSARDSASTRLTDNKVATHHMILQPTTSYQSGSSQTLGIKPGAVIDLSDVLTNTNLVGNLGETIKDIVNLFAANGNRPKFNATDTTVTSNDHAAAPPSGGITVSSAEEPVYIPIGAIGRTTQSSRPSQTRPSGLLQPSTILTGFTPMLEDEKPAIERNKDQPAAGNEKVLTSVVFGSNTFFIHPTSTVSEVPKTVDISENDGRYHSTLRNIGLQGSVSSPGRNQNNQATPGMKQSETTSVTSGLETIFFGLPDARKPPSLKTIQGSISTSSIVGVETIFFDSPEDFYAPGTNQINISGATTIFGTFPAITDSSSSSTPDASFTSSSSGETTIFFPVPGENSNQHLSPGTRYVTSVESVTLTLTLTTSSVYQTEDTPVTVTSVFTTTIPPRTFVSTIIGSRTILGTQPEPTEAVQVIPTMQPSESTTTVTTTTLIFNSIATTVVRTLVIPTNAIIQPTKATTNAATGVVKLGGVGFDTNQRPPTAERQPTTRKPIQLFKSGNRPTEPTTPKSARTGPPLKLFPTKPPTTTTKQPPSRPSTTKKTFRKPGKTLTPIVDGCLRECNLKNKEVCKQNPDRSWSCQCRPGFFQKEGSNECKDVKSYVVLVRVLKMGGDDVIYQPELSNHLSPEYKNITTTARKAVDGAYKTSSLSDDYVSTNVIGVHEGRGFERGGVLVNLTVQLKGEKPANEEFLKEELAQSLEAAESELHFANTSFVSPITQRVEDVQDFDECYDDIYNDCSRSSSCINLPGSYTCQCKEGYQDLEPLLPGRICSGEIKDCDYCNRRGVCIMTEDDNKFCRCYRMYLGKQCEINGLVLAIALPIALALLILTMFCLLCGCRKLRQKRSQKPKPNNVFKGMVPPMAGTLDRKAMIMDSSSESSAEHRPPPPEHRHAYDGFGDANSTMKRSRRDSSIDDHISREFQVPTVLIPRAKHIHPKQVNAPYPNYRMPPDVDRW